MTPAAGLIAHFGNPIIERLEHRRKSLPSGHILQPTRIVKLVRGMNRPGCSITRHSVAYQMPSFTRGDLVQALRKAKKELVDLGRPRGREIL
jgi:hypothetical protein